MAAHSRFVSTTDEEIDLENDSPLIDVDKAPALSLEAALKQGQAVGGLSDSALDTCLKCAQRRATKLLKGPELLTKDEIGAIFIYTLESPFYKNLNGLLRLRNREKLKPLFPYLKLLLTALHKLPPLRVTVFRGVKADVSAKYLQNDEIVWWGFGSTTGTAGVLEDPLYLGTSGPRTLFSIVTRHAVDICRYSAFGTKEDERLLMPGVQLKVKSKLPLADGLQFIQLEECTDSPLLSGFAFAASRPASAQSLLVPRALAKAEDRFGWDHMRRDLKRAIPDWAALVAHCQQHGHNDARCQYVLGLCHWTGEGVAQDLAEAVRLFRMATGKSYPPAQAALGVCYDNGQGVTQDKKEAVRWYRRAAEAGNDDGQNNLGDCYRDGQGVAQDYKEAMRWYRRAAEAGHAAAQFNLGVCYGNGQGVAQDDEE
eukprot:EG_transcript_13666